MAGRRTSGGLVCSHGSDLDMRLPRAKMPSSALPPEVRAKMGLKPRKPRRRSKGAEPYKAGAGVLKPRESQDGNYAAGCQKNFLRRGSGHSFGSQYESKERHRTYSKPTQSVSETGYGANHARRKKMQSQKQQQKQGRVMSRRAAAQQRQSHQQKRGQPSRRPQEERPQRAGPADREGQRAEKFWNAAVTPMQDARAMR